MTSLGGTALGVAQSLVVKTELLAALAAIGLLLLCMCVTWLFVRMIYATHGSAFAKAESELMIELKGVGGATVLTALSIPQSVSDAFESLGSSLVNNIDRLLLLATCAILSLLFLTIQPDIVEWGLTVRQCLVMPNVQAYIWPLLNLARLLYSSVIPLVGMGVQWYKFVTTDYYQLLFACADPQDFQLVLENLSTALSAAVQALADWLGGDIANDPLDLTAALAAIGDAANAATDVLNCFCEALDPVWAFVIALPQIVALQVAINAAVNVGVRILQIPMNALLLGLLAPNLEPLVIEINTAIIAIGDTAQEVALLLLDMILAILDELGLLVATDDAVAAGLGLSAVAASREAVTPLQRRDALVAAIHGALRTTASPLAVAGASNLAAAGLDVATPIWDIPMDGDTLNSTVGLVQLIQLLSMPWSHVITEPMAAWFTAWNQTVALVTHLTTPDCDGVFDSPVGLQWLQTGPIFDRLRNAADAFPSAFVVLDTNLPAVYAHALRAILYMIQAVPELVPAFLYSLIFPPWVPATPAYTACDACDACPFDRSAAPVGWSIVQVLVYYGNWSESCLVRARDELLLAGDALATVAGCNITIDAECAESPAGCFLQKLIQTATELVRLVETFILTLPDLTRFNYNGYQSFDTITLDPTTLVVLWNATFDCLTSFLDELDGPDHCITSDVPFDGGIQPNPNVTLPPADDEFPPPRRMDVECHADGYGYTHEQEVYLSRNLSSGLLQPALCNIDETSNGCMRASGQYNGSRYILNISGSPTSGFTLYVYPRAYDGTPPLPITFTQDNGLAIYPSAFDQVNIYNVDFGSALLGPPQSDCTGDMPRTAAPLTAGVGCYVAGTAAPGYLAYRTLNGNSTASHLQTVYKNCGACIVGVAIDCVYDYHPYISGVACVAFPGFVELNYPGLGTVFVAHTDFDTRLAVPGLCVDPLGGPDNTNLQDSLCRNGILYYVSPLDTRQITPYYPSGYPDMRIPCIITTPDPTDFTCLTPPLGPLLLGTDAELDQLASDFDDAFLDNPLYTEDIMCDANVNSTQPPCIETSLEWNTGDNIGSVHIIVEGNDIRVRFNDSWPETLVCQTYLNNMAGATNVASPPPPVGVETFQQMMDATSIRLQNEAFTAATGQPVAPSQDIDYMIYQPPNGTTYRKKSLVCCLSEAINDAGGVVSAYVLEILLTIRGILTALAIDAPLPDVFYVPTFSLVVDKLRNSLCKLMCAFTRLLPVTFACDQLYDAVDFRCSNGSECSESFLCRIVDVLLNVLVIIVELLQVVRVLIHPAQPAPASNILANSCGTGDDALLCIAAVVVYAVQKIVYSATAVVRSFAALADCLICAIAVAVDEDAVCVHALFDFIDTIMDLVDGICSDILPLLVKMAVLVIHAIISLFSFQWDEFWEDLGMFFDTLGQLFVNLGNLIFQFLMELPVIGDLLSFISSIYTGACDIVSDMIIAFGGSVSLECTGFAKRGVQSTLPANLTNAWYAPGGAAGCALRSAQLYFDGANPTSDESKEFIFCMAAAQWLPASAGGVSDQVYGGGTSAGAAQHTCDMRMPGFYSSGKTWPQLSTEEQAYAYSTCLWPRMIMEHARVIKGVDWAPVDLLYNPGVRIPLLLDDLAYGYSVYTQYRDDRASLPWTVARDDKYASNWQASGFSVAHLPALRVMSLEAADLAMATDDATLGLTIEQYAARNVALGTAWRTRDPVVIAGTAKYWRNILGRGAPAGADANNATTTTGGNSSLGALFGRLVEKVAAQQILDPPPFAQLKLSALGNNTLRARKQMNMMSMRTILAEPFIVVARFMIRWRDANVTATGIAAGRELMRAAVASVQLAREFVDGTAYDSAKALDGYVGFDKPTTPWRLWPKAAGALGNWAQRLNIELGSVARKAWSAGPGQLFALASALSGRSTVAAARRAKFVQLGNYLGVSVLREWYAVRAEQTYGASASGMISHARGLRPTAEVPCLSPFQELCDLCLYLDNAVGTVLASVVRPIAHYTGPVDQEPSLAFSKAAYTAFKTTFAAGAPAVFGDSDDLPPRWPSPSIDNWRWFGDATANKLRFDDLAELWATLFGMLENAFTAATDNASAGTINTTSLSGVNMGSTRSINTMMGQSLRSAVCSSNTSFCRPGATLIDVPPPGELNMSMTQWAEFVYKSVRSCTFTDELDGSHKRFAIAEAALIVGGIAAAGTLAVAIPVLGFGFATLGAVIGSTSMAIALGTIVVAYDWSYRCAPAFPYGMGDDLTWMASRTLLSASDFFFAGVLNAAEDGSDPYTAAASVVCENYVDGTFTAGWCVVEQGFSDIGMNAVFIINWTWPEALDWLNETQTPLISNLVQTDWAQDRLSAFDNVDMTDPVTFSQMWSCGLTYTAMPNFFIAMAVLVFLFQLLAPFIRLFVKLLIGACYPAFLALCACYTLFGMIVSPPFVSSVAQASTPLAKAVRLAARPRQGPVRGVRAVERPLARMLQRAMNRLARGVNPQREPQREAELQPMVTHYA